MSGPVDEEKELARNRKTLMLLVGGALSLLVPLLGVAYMHWKDIRAAGPAAAPSEAVFEHRGADGSGSEVRPAATPAPDVPASLAQVPVLPPRQSSPAPVQATSGNNANNIDPGGSLGYVRASSDFQSQPQQAAAAPPAQQQTPKPAAPPPRQVQRPAAQASVASLAAKKAKPAPKPFMMPHLHGGGFGGGQPMGGMQGGMGSMQGGMQGGMGGMQGGMGGMQGGMGGMQGGMGGAQGGGMPGGVNPAQAMAAMQQMQGQGGGSSGAPNMGAMMQQMQQQGAGAGGGAGAVPNMGAMMQQMQNMQQQGGAGAGGGQPNMNQMMQQMQQMQGQQQPQQQ